MKRAITTDIEIKTGVAAQCTTQRAEAHIPRLSAEKAEARNEEVIKENSFEK
jgi:hypothetical protein